MLKKLYFIVLLAICIACDKEDANNCFQTSGNLITEEITMNTFSKIEVNEDINLVVKEGAIQEVIIETGANLINDVEAKVIGDTLFLFDNNDCNYVRDYGITTIYVTSPNITEINSKTQFEVRSDGILTFPELKLVSENFTNESVASGNFNLQVQNQEVTVTFNNLSNLFISGSTTVFDINFPGGNSRVEAENLVADTVSIFSRGSNDIIINPQVKLSGNIYGTGDVIAVNKPTEVTLTSHYTGSLIFN
ncbi:head GIN domain-containing protein [uncultured Kordia sp.]|uniref:head GIN domain-containing protein n=1 Tax=uncultured Kordia sp. TaxID=507699 RepID=UPI002621F806|nr:head GIN domain-containing protein [uncultured Kordia sp.]